MARRYRSGQVRIIAGEWRGRRIDVALVEGLRPSGDRVRETLFNWLQPYLGGANCLDLFAGTGVLGLEALSRGAARCVLVERDRRASAQLRNTIDRLGARNATVFAGDALDFLQTNTDAFDLVFVDPPFAPDAIAQAQAALLQTDALAANALVYVECAATAPLELAPWKLLNQRVYGAVCHSLFAA